MTVTAARQIVPCDGVKICGIREPRHAVTAIDAGADMLGFVFAPSRRRITAADAVACVDAVRGSNAAMVGLFVDATADEINCTCRDVGLDAVQHHGDVTPDLIRAVEVPVIQVLRPIPADRPTPADDSWSISSRLIGFSARASVPSEGDVCSASQPVAYMLDAVVPGAHGGTGVLADWALAASLAGEVPLMLAGGLTEGNVASAITTVHPRAVDVSSGVETDGIKDEAKIRAFVSAAKAAFALG